MWRETGPLCPRTMEGMDFQGPGVRLAQAEHRGGNGRGPGRGPQGSRDPRSGTPPSGGLKRREWPRGPAGSCAVRAGR